MCLPFLFCGFSPIHYYICGYMYPCTYSCTAESVPSLFIHGTHAPHCLCVLCVCYRSRRQGETGHKPPTGSLLTYAGHHRGVLTVSLCVLTTYMKAPRGGTRGNRAPVAACIALVSPRGTRTRLN